MDEPKDIPDASATPPPLFSGGESGKRTIQPVSPASIRINHLPADPGCQGDNDSPVLLAC